VSGLEIACFWSPAIEKKESSLFFCLDDSSGSCEEVYPRSLDSAEAFLTYLLPNGIDSGSLL